MKIGERASNIVGIEFKKFDKIVISFLCMLAIVVIVAPLLLLGKYNFASADDWSYGIYSYRAIRNGEGLFGILNGVCRIVKEAYLGWDGRFGSNIFLAIQPGIFGEGFYAIVPFLMIGMVAFSELFLLDTIITLHDKNNKWLIFPIAIPWIILQLLFVPYPVETFYWYSGSFSYTFINGLAILAYALFIRLAESSIKTFSRSMLSFLLSLMLIIVGSGNYTTQIYVVLLIFLHSIFYCLKDRSKYKHICFAFPTLFISMIICFAAPGRVNTFNTNYAGGNQGFSAFESIIMSLYRTLTNIYSWTNRFTIIIILLTLPFVLFAVEKIDSKYRFPGIFSILTFGIYSSMLTPTLYAQGNNGGCRTADILWYMYVVWVVANEIYWCGWIRTKITKESMIKCKKAFFYLYCSIISMILMLLLISSKNVISSYKAYRTLKLGEAQRYASEWNERFKILRDDNIRDVEFDELSITPELICYTDLQPEDGYTWVNTACARYYEKDSIVIRHS